MGASARFAVTLIVALIAAASALASDLTVQLGWVDHPSFAGFYVAADQGYFADEGLSVRLVPGGPGYDSVDAVASGAAAIGMAWGDALLEKRAAGVPVVALAAIYRRSPVTFFSLPDLNIRHPRDFVGKRIRATPDLLPALRFLMDRFGIASSAYEIVSLPSDPTQVMQGDVDIWGAYVTGLPAQLEARGRSLNHVYPQDYGYRAYARVIFATEEAIRSRRADLVGFLRASMRGWQWAIANHQAVVPYVRRRTTEFSDEEIRQMFAVTIPLVHTGQDRVGWMSRDDWAASAGLLVNAIPAVAGLDLDTLFDLSLLREAYSGAAR